MKIGSIARPNAKGQVVIPKEVRDALGIDANALLTIVVRGRGIYMYPIDEVITKVETESSFLKMLEKTKGTWAERGWTAMRRRKRKTELAASKRRRRAW